MHVRRGDRVVAHFNRWTETVRPVFSALPPEVEVLEAWEGPRAREM